MKRARTAAAILCVISLLAVAGCARTDHLLDVPGAVDSVVTIQSVQDFAFTPDGNDIIAVSGGDILRYRAGTGEPVMFYRLSNVSISDGFQAVAVSRDGRLIAGVGGRVSSPFKGQSIGGVLLDLQSGETITPLFTDIDIYSDQTMSAVAFSPDGQTIIAAHSDKIFRWRRGTHGFDDNLATQSPDYHRHPVWVGKVRALEFSSDGQVVMASPATLWHVDSLRVIYSFLEVEGDRVYGSLYPDGVRAVIGSEYEVILVDLTSGKITGILPNGLQDTKGDNEFEIRSIDVSDDGRYFVTGDNHGTVRLYDGANGQLLALQPGEKERSILRVLFAPDNATFGSYDDKGTLRLWRLHL